MDFDLFDIEDDDLILSAFPASTEKTQIATNSYPEFNCTGEDSTNNLIFSHDSFTKNYVIFNKNYNHKNCAELTIQKFNVNSLNSNMIANYVFNQARINIQKLVVSIKTPIDMEQTSYYQARRQVTILLQTISFIGNSLLSRKFETHLKSMRNLLNQIGNKDLFKLIFLANSIRGNETDSPAYHFLHGYLEWRFLDLIILQKFNDSNEQKIIFQNQLAKVFDDLIQISACLYKKKNLPESMFLSSFPCVCIKEFWLLLQYLTEDLNMENMHFWTYFNKTIEKLKTNPDFYSLNFDNIPEFTIWLLKGVTQLHGYNSNGNYIGVCSSRVIENFEILEHTVEQFFNLNPTEEQIRTVLCNLMPILLEWWPPKVDVSMIIWEHYNKKLNSSFFIAGSAPNTLAVTCSSGKGYLEKIRNLLENSNQNLNISSFSLFTIILGKTIERFLKNHKNNQMQKIIGRIFSKFSTSKFLLLNETGIHHLIELFLTLALNGDIFDIGPKIKDKLLSISLEKITLNRQICIAKGHVAMLLLFTENSLDISEYVMKFLEQLNLIQNDINVSKIIAEGMRDIFQCSRNFDKGEHLIIDSWITNFLNSCTTVEQERTLEALHMIFEKIKTVTILPNSFGGTTNLQNLIKSLNLNVLPFVKQNFSSSFSNWLPIMAADFCIYTNGNDLVQFQKNFKFFAETNCANKQAVLQFLLEILSSDKSCSVDSAIILQIWLKSLVLLTANNEDVVRLTKIVTTLNDFKCVCDLSENDLLEAKEPLCLFVSAIGSKYETCNDYQRKCLISDKFNGYLISFEKWLTDKNDKTEISFRFYSFIAIVIFNCSNIVYARSKISCFFHVAMTRFILPQSLQMGKIPEQKLAQIVHKIWPVVVQGIGKLNFKTDPYISKTLTDLIVKWLPHFKISSNLKIVARPYVNCLSNDNEQLSLFVFEKLTSVFLVMQRRQADPNACLVINIFQEVIDTISNDAIKLKVYLKATCLVTLEHLMMVDESVPSRRMLHELFKKIIKSQGFLNSNEIKNLIIEHLKILTLKHLSYFTLFYFDLLTLIANICVELVESIMEFLFDQIKIVENKRGGGEDNRLRSCMDKLKGAILAAKTKK